MVIGRHQDDLAKKSHGGSFSAMKLSFRCSMIKGDSDLSSPTMDEAKLVP
jgi:hypothetical protein